MGSQLAKELNRFSAEQRRRIYENLYGIELTDGCSIGCDFCGFEAAKGVKSEIPSIVLEQIAEEMAQLTDRTTNIANTFKRRHRPNRLRLYDATDPLDYKNYFDVRALFSSKGFEVATSTGIPEGKEEVAIENLDHIYQISVSHMNRERLMPYFQRLGIFVYIDVFNYYRDKFGKEVFEKAPRMGQVKVTDTVKKTIKRLRKEDPTLPKKTRFYDLRTDRNRPHEEVQDIKTLCLWCGDEGPYPREGKIVDRDEGGVKDYGRAFDLDPHPSQYGSMREHFCDTSGVKITPGGVFNVLAVRHSKDYRTGRIIEKVSPDNFHVIRLKYDQVSNLQFITVCDYA